MTLNDTLRQIKEASRSRIPAAAAAVMSRATEQLEKSGIKRMALEAGKPAPEFALQDWQGRSYNSAELLSSGPLVLTFYRGYW